MNETQKTPATVPAAQGPLNGLDVPQTLADKPADAAQVAADAGKALRCPVCGGRAQGLPQGQLLPWPPEAAAGTREIGGARE